MSLKVVESLYLGNKHSLTRRIVLVSDSVTDYRQSNENNNSAGNIHSMVKNNKSTEFFQISCINIYNTDFL